MLWLRDSSKVEMNVGTKGTGLDNVMSYSAGAKMMLSTAGTGHADVIRSARWWPVHLAQCTARVVLPLEEVIPYFCSTYQNRCACSRSLRTVFSGGFFAIFAVPSPTYRTKQVQHADWAVGCGLLTGQERSSLDWQDSRARLYLTLQPIGGVVMVPRWP